MRGHKYRQAPLIEAMLAAGKKVAICSLNRTIIAELRGDHCAVQFLTDADTRWTSVPPPTFYDEVREIDEAMLRTLIKRRA